MLRIAHRPLIGEALQSPAESVCLLEMKNLGQAEDGNTGGGAFRCGRRCGLGKPWENHGKMVVSWDFMGFYGILPSGKLT